MKKKLTLTGILVLCLAGQIFAHSDAFKPDFVQTLIAPYLAAQTALAADDLDKAKVASAEFVTAMKAFPDADGSKEEVADLKTPADELAAAKDLATARTAFLALSNEMKTLVKHVGISGDESLFLIHCPMAFGNKGGDWLQSSKTVANPYFGSMMLHCGAVKAQVAGDKHDEAPADHHGHHH